MKFFDVEPLADYDQQIGILLASLQDSTREWRDEMEDAPPEAVVWQARPNGHSVGSVILHIIDVEAYWFETFAAKKRRSSDELKLLLSEEVQQYGGRWPVPPKEPLSWYYELHDQIRKRAFEALRGIEPERVYVRKDMQATLRWVVAHVVEHDSYHGGQAVLLYDLWREAQKRGAKS